MQFCIPSSFIGSLPRRMPCLLEAFAGMHRSRARGKNDFASVTNRMLVSLKGGEGELGNLKP
jgi:hypothetical protein